MFLQSTNNIIETMVVLMSNLKKKENNTTNSILFDKKNFKKDRFSKENNIKKNIIYSLKRKYSEENLQAHFNNYIHNYSEEY